MVRTSHLEGRQDGRSFDDLPSDVIDGVERGLLDLVDAEDADAQDADGVEDQQLLSLKHFKALFVLPLRLRSWHQRSGRLDTKG